MKRITAALLSVIMLFSGCSKKDTVSSELPEDTPWNSGMNAILETDSGYYIYNGDIIFLRYHDKASGKEIMLCDKPECAHDGSDSCTATYRMLRTGRNAVLYDGYLYFYAVSGDGEKAEVVLYKASPDGSSLDRVGVIYSCSLNGHTEELRTVGELIIHKGYAFINYNLETVNGGYGNFFGAGFSKMDIRTGKSERILFTDDFFEESIYQLNWYGADNCMFGSGDYVYYNNPSKGASRINIFDSTTEVLRPECDYSDTWLWTVGGDTVCYSVYNSEDNTVTAELADAAEPGKILYSISHPYEMSSVMIWQGKVLIYSYSQDTMYVYEKGSLVREIFCGETTKPDYYKPSGFWYDEPKFKISCGKMYYIEKAQYDSGEGTRISSCPLEEFLEGKVQWHKEYDLSETSQAYSDLMYEKKLLKRIIVNNKIFLSLP